MVYQHSPSLEQSQNTAAPGPVYGKHTQKFQWGIVIPTWTCVELRQRTLGTMNAEDYCGLPTNVWDDLSQIPITVSSTQSRRDLLWQNTQRHCGAVRPTVGTTADWFYLQYQLQLCNLPMQISKQLFREWTTLLGANWGRKINTLSLAGEMDAVTHPQTSG